MLLLVADYGVDTLVLLGQVLDLQLDGIKCTHVVLLDHLLELGQVLLLWNSLLQLFYHNLNTLLPDLSLT